jgi:catechol 2,3-dioxygenase-like lactoylglutathione lyase family enzyme
MIDHVVLNVKDLDASKRFYEQALAPLGYAVVMALPEGVGLGPQGKPMFWIASRGERHTEVHVAFGCAERQPVRDFHEAAIKAGGTDNGAPGLREMYHPNYYAAFVLDPDGNNIEAVCHVPES